MDLVILDIDETLVHSCDEWIGRSHDFLAADRMMFERPYVREFIDELISVYKIGIWTAASGQYLTDIINHLFGSPENLEFIWDRDECQLHENELEQAYFAKNLIKVHEAGWKEGQFTMIDDRPEYIVGNRANIVSVKPFYGSIKDEELKALLIELKRNA